MIAHGAAAASRSSRWRAGGSRSSRPRRRRRIRCSPTTCCRSTAPRDVTVSGNLAHRAALRRDLDGLDADVFLVELKAAAVDVVAEAALARGDPGRAGRRDVRSLPGERRPRRGAARARPGPGGRRVTEPRRLEPLPLGAHGGPRYSKGLMARALMATGLAPEPAYALARRLEREAPARNGEGITLDHVEEVATELLGDDRARRGAAAPPLRAAPGARRADRAAPRRRHRHRQVDDRDRGRVPARDHARHLHRLHPPDDAGVLLARLHAVGALLELRGARRRAGHRPSRGCRASSIRRATSSSACRRRSTGRCTRAGRW